MRRKVLLAALLAGLCSLTAFAAYPHGVVTWGPGSPTVTKNKVSASGTYATDKDWTPHAITFHLMNKDGGFIWQSGATLDLGNWAIPIAETKVDWVPNGTYVAWVIFEIKSGSNSRYIAEQLKEGLTVTDSNAKAWGAGGSVTFGANQPVGGKAQVSGSGMATPAAGWQKAPGNPVLLSALPVNGGRVYVQPSALPINTWTATITPFDDADRNRDYHVIATFSVEPQVGTEGDPHNVGTSFTKVTVK
jgi:hypothetical protein